MIDLDEGMIYRDGQRIIYVLTIEEFRAVIDREKQKLTDEVDTLKARLKQRLRRERHATELERDLQAATVEVARLEKRVFELENPKLATPRQIKSRSRANARYDRYRYLCDLHGIPRQHARWSGHLSEIERTLARVAA